MIASNEIATVSQIIVWFLCDFSVDWQEGNIHQPQLVFTKIQNIMTAHKNWKQLQLGLYN
jgi:hypothetical protein